jgi:hypothetical protein
VCTHQDHSLTSRSVLDVADDDNDNDYGDALMTLMMMMF